MKKKLKKSIQKNKKPLVIAAVGAGMVALGAGLAGAFRSMKKSAKAQHELDKENFAAAKAEAKKNFEVNRGKNTFERAKADAKKNWERAKNGDVGVEENN